MHRGGGVLFGTFACFNRSTLEIWGTCAPHGPLPVRKVQRGTHVFGGFLAPSALVRSAIMDVWCFVKFSGGTKRSNLSNMLLLLRQAVRENRSPVRSPVAGERETVGTVSQCPSFGLVSGIFKPCSVGHLPQMDPTSVARGGDSLI